MLIKIKNRYIRVVREDLLRMGWRFIICKLGAQKFHSILIRLKIEKAKELLKYENLIGEEITFRLNYSSLSHLSRQFKEVTGYNLSGFKKMIRD
ncbi:MAG: helix-turn-helix domain-containing protein [Cyclobacteriaceae bacterium]